MARPESRFRQAFAGARYAPSEQGVPGVLAVSIRKMLRNISTEGSGAKPLVEGLSHQGRCKQWMITIFEQGLH